MHRSILLVLPVLLALTLGSAARAQLDAESLMREGNALFRSGLYRAALLRYREAGALGLNSPLLAYNLGVTYFKLGDLEDAERSFERASQDPDLSALATYNLGLTHRAAGRETDAAQAFAAVEQSGADRGLRRLAERAGAGSSARPQATDTVPARQRTFASAERVPGLTLTIDAALGHDDNVNRSPAEPYVDLAQPGQPIVVAQTIAASYVPVRAIAEYVVGNEARDTDYYFRYRLDGDYYTDALAHDESNQRLDIGADVVLGDRTDRTRTVRSAFFLTRHHQRNFDPDTGLDRDIAGLDLSGRFYYGAAGIEADFDHTVGKWRWGFDARLERREYDRVALVANYDNELYLFRASADYSINAKTTVSFGVRRYRRLFDELLARNLDGTMPSTNPALEYGYAGVGVGFDRKLTEHVDLELSYLSLERTDRFVGYNDYTQDVWRLHAEIEPRPRFSLSFGLVSRVYDYPNAFAFNAPAAGPKELEDVAGEAHVEFRMNRNFVLFAEVATSDVESTDTRAEYARAQTILGVAWRR